MPAWRSVRLGPLDVHVGGSPSPQFPGAPQTAQDSRHAVVSMPFIRLEVRFPRRWGELSPEEQDARLHDRL